MFSISVVINTLNEEKNIERVMQSVKWADEIIVCDMMSDDHTVMLAKKMGAKIVFHKRVGYVEPARNFAISKASSEWILLVDADEEIPPKLAKYLQEFIKHPDTAVVEIPRKNIIFGKWMQASFWWPDYNIRFFRKEAITWGDEIHSKPEIKGGKLSLPLDEELAIVHYNYQSLVQFIDRMNRYTSIQAEELNKAGYKFNWKDLITKTLGEFLGRYFANKGFEDGLHGLALSLLQAFSHLVMCLKVWEMEKFKPEKIDWKELKDVKHRTGDELNYWFKYANLSNNPFKRFFQKVKNRI